MKKKIEILMARLLLAIRLHPVEVLLSVAFALLGCIHFESGYDYKFLETPLVYFPVLFLATYTLNGLFSRTSNRWIYYMSALFCLPFSGGRWRGYGHPGTSYRLSWCNSFTW